MRTLLTVLLAAGVAGAAVPPQPTAKTFDVSELIGADGPFPTADDVRAVVVAFYGDWSEGCGIRKEVEGGKLTVHGYDSSHRRVEEFLGKLHDLKRRRNTQVTAECLIFTTPSGTGTELLLLPKEGTEPVVLTAKEAALTNSLIRATKAEGRLDVLSRPTLTLTHGHEGLFQVGQQFPEVISRSANTDGSVTQTVKRADAGLTTKLTATVQDGGTMKLTGSLSSSEVVSDKVQMTHEGQFATELKAGGTAVARIPTVAGETEMYLMLTVTSVGVAKKAEPAKTADKPPHAYDILPPVVVPLAPTLGGAWEVTGDRTFTYRTPLVLPLPTTKPGEQLRFVGENGVVFIPAAELGKPATPFGYLTRNPILGTLWTDKPKPAERKDFWGFNPSGIEWNY